MIILRSHLKMPFWGIFAMRVVVHNERAIEAEDGLLSQFKFALRSPASRAPGLGGGFGCRDFIRMQIFLVTANAPILPPGKKG